MAARKRRLLTPHSSSTPIFYPEGEIVLIENYGLGGWSCLRIQGKGFFSRWEVHTVPDSSADFFFGKLRAFSTWLSSTDNV